MMGLKLGHWQIGHVLFLGRKFSEFKIPVIAFGIFAVLLVSGPSLVFADHEVDL